MSRPTNRPLVVATSGTLPWTHFRVLGYGVMVLALMVLLGVGCASARQSVAELNSGLAWFVSLEHGEGWPFATQAGAKLEHEPSVVIAWSPPPDRDAEPTAHGTRADRERWIVAIKEKLDRSGLVTRVEGSPAETFEGGVTLAGLRGLATERGADLIVLFGLETAKRQYHAFEPLAGGPRGTADVANVLEVVASARAVGVASLGVPVFADEQNGFASGDSHARTVEELESIARRVAVDALGDAIVRRLSRISPDGGSR